jgi:hypothetical protein
MNYDIDNLDRYTVVVAAPVESNEPQAMFKTFRAAAEHCENLVRYNPGYRWQLLPMDVWRARFAINGG